MDGPEYKLGDLDREEVADTIRTLRQGIEEVPTWFFEQAIEVLNIVTSAADDLNDLARRTSHIEPEKFGRLMVYVSAMLAIEVLHRRVPGLPDEDEGENEEKAVRQFAPVQDQRTRGRDDPSTVPWAVHLAAYEVYCECYGPQAALIKDSCRGGFGTGELIAFLYARSFPRSEWRERCRRVMQRVQI